MKKNSGNLLVKGDNLLALKSLLPYYGGEVKMIYIDPPYNTGNTSWVYNDASDAPIIKKWLNKTMDAHEKGFCNYDIQTAQINAQESAYFVISFQVRQQKPK